MTQKFYSLLLALVMVSTIVFSQEKIRPVHVGLICPVSSNGVEAASYTNNFSLHAIAGISKNETRLSIYGFAGIVKNNVAGTQLSGFANITGNNLQGIQIAGFANMVKNNATGSQLAGFTNIAGSVTGTQVSGFASISHNEVKDFQLSGFGNKSGDVNSQVSGFINIAKKVKGVQLAGFINIADSSDCPIGIINIIKNGEKTIGISTDETFSSLVSFRSGGRIMYGILGAGYNFKSKRDLYLAEAGIGAHLLNVGDFRLNLELVSLMHYDFKKKEDYYKSTLRVLPAFRIGRCEIFAGPTLNHISYNKDKGEGLVNNYLWSKTNSHNNFNGLYLGVMGGVQFKL